MDKLDFDKYDYEAVKPLKYNIGNGEEYLTMLNKKQLEGRIISDEVVAEWIVQGVVTRKLKADKPLLVENKKLKIKEVK